MSLNSLKSDVSKLVLLPVFFVIPFHLLSRFVDQEAAILGSYSDGQNNVSLFLSSLFLIVLSIPVSCA